MYGWMGGLLNTFKLWTGAQPQIQPQIPTDKLEEKLKILEEKEAVFIEKASQENEKVKKFTIAKNRRVAMKHRKKKIMHEKVIALLVEYQLDIIQQMNMLERARATIETVNARRVGTAALKEMLKANNLASLSDFVEEFNEQQKIIGQIEEVLSAFRG